MNNNLMKTTLVGFIVFFSALFIGNVDVKALDKVSKCPSSNQGYQSAVSCSYFDNHATLIFAQNDDGNVCVTASKVEYEYSGLFTEKINDVTIRGLLDFDISSKTVSKVLNNKTCPKIKFVNEYDLVTNNPIKITLSDKDVSAVNCGISGWISFGSECAVSDGKDWTPVSSDDVNNVAKDTNKLYDHAHKEAANPEDINRWGQYGDGENSSQYVDQCDIIDSEIWNDIKIIFQIIVVGGILLLIIMSAIEFIKAITSSEEDKIKKSFKNTIIRVIACIILLLLPMIVTFLITIINENNVKKDDNGQPLIGETGKPLCNID